MLAAGHARSETTQREKTTPNPAALKTYNPNRSSPVTAITSRRRATKRVPCWATSPAFIDPVFGEIGHAHLSQSRIV